MRFVTPVLLCQFGWLVLGGDADADTVTEIDLLAPVANTTYGMSGNHRFPIVWALQNPQAWKTPIKIEWQLNNLTVSKEQNAIVDYGSATFSKQLANDAGAQFATFDTLLLDNGTYRLTWVVVNGCPNTALQRKVDFNTNRNSLAATDVYSALNLGCHNRSVTAYNITSDGCATFPDVAVDDQLPYIAPCSVGLDNTALAGIRNDLDTQYNRTCADPTSHFLCPQSSGSAAYKLGAEAWLMGFLLMVFFL